MGRSETALEEFNSIYNEFSHFGTRPRSRRFPFYKYAGCRKFRETKSFITLSYISLRYPLHKLKTYPYLAATKSPRNWIGKPMNTLNKGRWINHSAKTSPPKAALVQPTIAALLSAFSNLFAISIKTSSKSLGAC